MVKAIVLHKRFKGSILSQISQVSVFRRVSHLSVNSPSIPSFIFTIHIAVNQLIVMLQRALMLPTGLDNTQPQQSISFSRKLQTRFYFLGTCK